MSRYKKQLWQILVIPFLLVSSSVFALDLFKNSNKPCESELVHCTVEGSQCNRALSTSVSCKTAQGGVDFNQDGFPDCVLTVDQDIGIGNVSILMNRGEQAISCNSNPPKGDQFFPSVNLDYLGITGNVASVAVADLIGDKKQEVVIANADKAVPFLDFVAPPFPLVEGMPVRANQVTWSTNLNNQVGFSSNQTDKNLISFDCNNDQRQDLMIAVRSENGNLSTILLNILQNNGQGIQLASSIPTGVEGSTIMVASIASGDFNHDNLIDVVVAVGDEGEAGHAVLCFNQGVTPQGICSFKCSTPMVLNEHSPRNIFPNSVVTGDFNGDKNLDFAISENIQSERGGVHYFFRDQAGNIASNFHLVPTGLLPGEHKIQTLTTGCFNNDNIVDLAFSFNQSTTSGNVPRVNVVTSNKTGSFNRSIPLPIDPVLTAVNGIDAADFDQQGGDDLLLVGSIVGNGGLIEERYAYIFMNNLETLKAQVGEDQKISVNQPIPLSGKCEFDPEDTEAMYEVKWSVNSGDAVLTNTDTLTPTFSTSKPGNYVVTLSCRSRCTEIKKDELMITVVDPSLPNQPSNPNPQDPAGSSDPNALCSLEGGGTGGCGSTSPNPCSLVNPEIFNSIKPLTLFQWLNSLFAPAVLFGFWRIKKK